MEDVGLDLGGEGPVAVLLPMPWVPELVLVRARRVRRAEPRTQVRLLAGSTIAQALLVATIIAGPSNPRPRISAPSCAVA